MAKKNYLFLIVVFLCVGIPSAKADQWYKGCLHFHSLWSDGDAPPEVSISWYKEKGWHFVCITDHNLIPKGERYRPILEDEPPTEAHVQALREKFGNTWVQTKHEGNRLRMRLKTLHELKSYFDEPGRFLVIQGEEITTIGGNPHVNAINILEAIPFSGSGDIVDKTNTYFEAVAKQQEESQIPMIAILNHPSFANAITIEEALALPRLRFFEVYNGHPAVNNWGHEANGYPSTDRFWDVVMSFRLTEQPDFLLLGIATDDAHNYYDYRIGHANPGRGWIMVNAKNLTEHDLLEAMQKGNFYASTGVTLDSIERNSKGLSFQIIAEPGVSYRTQFVGSKKGFSKSTEILTDSSGTPLPRASKRYSDEIGTVFLETTDLNPSYTFTGDELYVRAIVISNKLQHNPFKEGDTERSWTQPVLNTL